MLTRQIHSPLIGGLLLAAAVASGCSSSASPESLNPSVNSSITWVGVDSRPLAVGSQLTLAFQLPAGKTASDEALTANSSDPTVLEITSLDLVNDRILVTALAPGQVAIALQGRDLTGELSVISAQATTIDFLDENYIAANMWVPLPRKGFGLLTGGQEVVGAILKDTAGQALNSRGLATYEPFSGALNVTKEEPEMFVLSRRPTAGTGASEGTFCAGLTSLPCNENSYPVTLVDAIAQVTVIIGTASDNVSIVAVAQAQDANQNPIFGVSDWEFSVSAGSFTRLSPAAVQVTAPAPVTGPVMLTATAVSEGVSGSIQLF